MLHSDSDDEYGLGYTPNFPKLNGNNIRTWYDDMQMHLKVVGSWKAANPDVDADEEAELKENERPSREQLRALNHIATMCEPNVRTLISSLRTGRGALRDLLKQYHRKDVVTRTLAFESFLNLRMDQDEDVMRWSSRIRKAAIEYEWAGGCDLEEVVQIAKFRQGLHEQYREHSSIQTLRNVLASQTDFNLHNVAIDVLDTMAFRSALRQHRVVPVATAAPFPPKNPAHKYTVCQICGKIGHIAYDCRSEVEGMANSKQIKRPEKQATKRRERDESRPASF